MPDELTPTQHTLLSLAGRSYRFESNREHDVWAELHMSMPIFWQQVNALIETAPAQATDPSTCHRLRRVRDARLRLVSQHVN